MVLAAWQEYCTAVLPNYTTNGNQTLLLPPDLWPLNSPDLNHLYYKIWDVIQQRVYQSQAHNVDKQKHMVKLWTQKQLLWEFKNNHSATGHEMLHFFVTNDTMFKFVSMVIFQKFELLTSQGSAATHLRCGGTLLLFCSKFHTIASSEQILKID